MVTNRAKHLIGVLQVPKYYSVFDIPCCSFGSIAITLRNRGTDAYKANEYGESIVVERRISRDGGSAYKIKNGKCQ